MTSSRNSAVFVSRPVSANERPRIAVAHEGRRVAVLLAQGKSVQEIAASTGRRQSTIRHHVKNMFVKHGLSRQADLLRLVRSLAGARRERR